LPDSVVKFSGLRGQVFERDGVTPHPNAQVFVIFKLSSEVVAAVTADADGFWQASGIPVDDWTVAAVSSDGRRKATRPATAAEGVTNFITLQLQGLETVTGQVILDNGTTVSNALVAGGELLVRTDGNGFFTLTGVPTGRRQIQAALERNDALGINITRLGSASIDVLPGFANHVVVRLQPRGPRGDASRSGFPLGEGGR
jgi:hypothetical protein